jgi:hypothetical protein
MKKVSGLALVLIGLLHSLLGLMAPQLIGFEGIWQAIANSGVIDAAKPDALQIWGYYWFLIAGFFLMLLGCLCYWIENHLDLPLPVFVGWGLLVIACFGIVLDIDSGFWLVLLVAVNAIALSRFRRQTT